MSCMKTVSLVERDDAITSDRVRVYSLSNTPVHSQCICIRGCHILERGDVMHLYPGRKEESLPRLLC